MKRFRVWLRFVSVNFNDEMAPHFSNAIHWWCSTLKIWKFNIINYQPSTAMLKMCVIFKQPDTHHQHWNEHECYAIMVKENYTTNSCCYFIFNFMRRSVLDVYGVVETGEIFRSVNKRTNFACRPIWYVDGIRCMVYMHVWCFFCLVFIKNAIGTTATRAEVIAKWDSFILYNVHLFFYFVVVLCTCMTND